MEKKIEELLRPRVKVENKWPGCPYGVGDILIKDGKWYWVVGDVGWYSKIDESEIEPHPCLMRPLQWWEERKPEEMPEFLKMKNFEKEYVVKVERNFYGLFYSESGEWPFISDGNRFLIEGKYRMEECYYYNFLPATEQEYNDYLASKETSGTETKN